MATDEKWLDPKVTIPIATNTYMNVHVVLSVNAITNLANELIDPGWSGIFSDPSEWISSLMYFPFALYAGTEQYLQIGPNTTEIPCYTDLPVYTWYFMGQWYCEPHFNNFADYNGFTKIQAWLPYLGFVNIQPNDVMGKYVQFRLKVDTTTGQGTYYIGVTDTELEYESPTSIPGYIGASSDLDDNTRIIAMYTVQLGVSIPLGQSNTSDVMRNIIMGGVKAALGAVSTYAAAQSIQPTTKTRTITNTARNQATGRQIKTGTTTMTETNQGGGGSYSFDGTVAGVFTGAATALEAMHVSSGSDRPNNVLSMVNGCKSIKIVVYRPKLQDVDDDYNALYGQPLGQTKALTDVTGYTEISAVHLDSTVFGTATAKELAELRQLLGQGVIL